MTVELIVNARFSAEGESPKTALSAFVNHNDSPVAVVVGGAENATDSHMDQGTPVSARFSAEGESPKTGLSVFVTAGSDSAGSFGAKMSGNQNGNSITDQKHRGQAL